ncbi:MAG: glycine--tRNA ligase subunit beta [Elusimicrobia bacterium]|nr:glycine--tRNA ligase subunit beta [Elusimicrobiota bacterium]
MVKDALLEIGVEEIPASYLNSALEQMKILAEKFLRDNQLAFSDTKVYGTPRRLTLVIKDVAEISEDRCDEILGPSVKVGRDEKNNFTMAAKGFASKYGVETEKLKVKKTDKGEYLCVLNKINGEKAEKILAECYSYVIKTLNFPKSMVWESSNFRFARPIRNLTALYGEKKIKIKVANVKSDNITYALHSSANKKVVIRSAEKYIDLLRNACVLADAQERKKVIEKIIDSASKRVKGEVLKDENLLDEINCLVEHPVAIVGTFDEKYLKLPHEILTNCMAKKQKYFAISDSKGKLTNYFLGIRNGMSENNEVVREGFERVLKARLDDAEFFFHKDTKSPLSEKVEKLKGVVLQEKLGTIYDKISRVKEIAKYLAPLIGVKADVKSIEKSCDLSKADLVTDMVFEYPELQGVVGRIYAQKDGESEQIYRSIEEHYWPINAESKLPATDLGILLSISDKVDTLIGDFSAGLIPTGSYDPYGLRRMAVGILRILEKNSFHVSLKELTEKAFSILPEKLKQNKEAIGQLMDFFRQRLEGVLENQGFAFDEIRAVITRSYDDVVDVKKRISALKTMRSKSDFESLMIAFRRASNILKQASKTGVQFSESVDETLLKEESEKSLYADIKRIETELKGLLEKKDYLEALQKIVLIKKSLDDFFEKILVMADDVKIRSNRLSMLNYLLKPFYNILDFSLIQGIGK